MAPLYNSNPTVRAPIGGMPQTDPRWRFATPGPVTPPSLPQTGPLSRQPADLQGLVKEILREETNNRLATLAMEEQDAQRAAAGLPPFPRTPPAIDVARPEFTPPQGALAPAPPQPAVPQPAIPAAPAGALAPTPLSEVVDLGPRQPGTYPEATTRPAGALAADPLTVAAEQDNRLLGQFDDVLDAVKSKLRGISAQGKANRDLVAQSGFHAAGPNSHGPGGYPPLEGRPGFRTAETAVPDLGPSIAVDELPEPPEAPERPSRRAPLPAERRAAAVARRAAQADTAAAEQSVSVADRFAEMISAQPDEAKTDPSTGEEMPWQKADFVTAGLAMMTAAGRPGATLLSSIGNAGLTAMNVRSKRQATREAKKLKKQEYRLKRAEAIADIALKEALYGERERHNRTSVGVQMATLAAMMAHRRTEAARKTDADAAKMLAGLLEKETEAQGQSVTGYTPKPMTQLLRQVAVAHPDSTLAKASVIAEDDQVHVAYRERQRVRGLTDAEVKTPEKLEPAKRSAYELLMEDVRKIKAEHQRRLSLAMEPDR